MGLRILIAEGVEPAAEAFEALLSTRTSFDVVARVRAGDQVLDAVRTHRPDVAVMEVDMPGMSGIEATAALRRDGRECKILLLSAAPGNGHLQRALAAGADGCLPRPTTGARLIEAIEAVAQGRTIVDPEPAADAPRSGPNPLTDRERDILRLVNEGHGTGEIATRLFLSSGTVRNYLSSAMSKLRAGGRIEAVAIARRSGWI